MIFPRRRSHWRQNFKSLFLKPALIISRIPPNDLKAKRFREFQKEHLNIDETKLELQTEVEIAAKQFDALVCGSDQIWSPSEQYGVDPIYFLNFNHLSTVTTVSYAPSFGSLNIKDEHWEQIVECIKKIDKISVREIGAAKLLSERANIEATVVPDPVILLGKFLNLIHRTTNHQTRITEKDSKYIFSYCLRSSDGVRQLYNYLSSQTGIEAVSSYNPHRRWKEVGKTIYPGPIEWVQLINEAKFVSTNSFHGVVFSLVLNKDFIAFSLPGQRSAISDRLVNLLEQVGLRNRLFAPSDHVAARKVLSSAVDWGPVNAKLARMKLAGESWLKESLK